MHNLKVLIDGPIAADTKFKRLSFNHYPLTLTPPLDPEDLREIVASHTQVVLLGDFRHPKASGWHFAELADIHPFLFPIGVVGITDRIRDLDQVISVVETLCPNAEPDAIHFAVNNAAANAASRHRRWQHAELAVYKVRRANDQGRRAKGLPLISDAAWNQACLILCRASLEHGDDWETEALDQLIGTFEGEM